MNLFLQANKRNSGWTDFEFTVANLTKIHKKIFDATFKKDDKDFFYNAINPTTNKSVINEISRFEDSGFRDHYILSEIEKYWHKGLSLFVIYGTSHAVMHEVAIRDMVQQ